MEPPCFWREDIDSLAFRITGHGGLCVVHQLALRTVIGHLPDPAEALAYWETRRAVFERAAAAKITRTRVIPGANFHLNSRELEDAGAASP
jgi:hypothetical protein